ncbi:DNA primase [Pseudomonadota bacterium]
MAPRIPQTFIDELLSRIDIVDVIDARAPLTKAGKEYKACCPFHEERTPSFTVSPGKQFYHCFGCGAHGTAISFLMEYSHMEFREAIETLAEQVGLPIPQDAENPTLSSTAHKDLLTMVSKADRYYQDQLREHPQAEKAIKYLKDRGLSGEIAAQFGIGFAPDGWDNLVRKLGTNNSSLEQLQKAGLTNKKDSGGAYDRFRHRIMFPILDHRGRVVGFGGRALGDGEPKYLNSPETPLFHKGNELYGLYRARGAIKEQQATVVVEGYMDVIALAQFEINNVVATLGTATTRPHIDRLFRQAPEIILCFDGDRAGRAAAWRALETAMPTLHDGYQIRMMFLPDGEDPDSLVRKEGARAFRGRLENATSLADFLFQTLIKQVDITSLEGKARLVELARPHLEKLPDGILRELMFDQLSTYSHAKRDTLPKYIGHESAPLKTRKPQRPSTAKRPSLVKLAITLLIQNPILAKSAEQNVELRKLEIPGISLLVELLLLLESHPNLNTAAIVERFRGTNHHNHLEKLSVWSHLIPAELIESEFLGIIAKLADQLREQQTDELLQQSQHRTLTDEENNQLLGLLSGN